MHALLDHALCVAFTTSGAGCRRGVVWLGEDWNWGTVTSLAMIIIGVVALNMSGAH